MKIKKIFTFLLTEFIYNGHLQSIGAVAIVNFYNIYIYQSVIDFKFSFAIYSLFESIFLFDRYLGFKKDKDSNLERTKHISSYKRFFPQIILFMSIFSLSIFLEKSLSSFLMAGSILFMGFMYPIYFKSFTKFIYLFKNLYVSGVYAIIVFFVTNKFQIIPTSYVFLQSMIAQILLDIKDISSDGKDRLKTFGVLFGKNKALQFVLVLIIFSCAFYYQKIFGFIILIDFAINISSVYLINKNNKSGYLLTAAKFLPWLLLSVVA